MQQRNCPILPCSSHPQVPLHVEPMMLSRCRQHPRCTSVSQLAGVPAMCTPLAWRKPPRTRCPAVDTLLPSPIAAIAPVSSNSQQRPCDSQAMSTSCFRLITSGQSNSTVLLPIGAVPHTLGCFLSAQCPIP